MKNLQDYISEAFIIKKHQDKIENTNDKDLVEKPAKFCSKARCIEVMKQGWDIKDSTEKSLFYIKYCLANFLTNMHIKYVDIIKSTGSYRRDTFVFEYKGVKFGIISGENWYNDESYYKIYGLGDDDEGSKAQNNGRYNNDYVWYKAAWANDFSGQSKHISILFNKDNIETTKQIIELVCQDYCYKNPYKDIDKIRFKKRDRCLFNHGDRKIFR